MHGKARELGFLAAIIKYTLTPNSHIPGSTKMADDEEALKIIVVGPSKSGKTFFSNLLAEVRVAERTLGAADEDAYSATAGVRILEFERSVNTGNGMQSVSIQLWDSSGDNGKENLWPAIQKDAAGA